MTGSRAPLTVRLPNWLVGDGEFDPATVGDVVHLGLAWLSIETVENVEDEIPEGLESTTNGTARAVGRLAYPRTPGGTSRVPVLLSGIHVFPFLEELPGADRRVRVSGVLGVERLAWDMQGYLWPLYPRGVRPWRLVGVRALPDLAPRDRVPGLEEIGSDELVLDLVPVSTGDAELS